MVGPEDPAEEVLDALEVVRPVRLEPRARNGDLVVADIGRPGELQRAQIEQLGLSDAGNAGQVCVEPIIRGAAAVATMFGGERDGRTRDGRAVVNPRHLALHVDDVGEAQLGRDHLEGEVPRHRVDGRQ